MCEAVQIRFLHVMRHDEYPGTLTCGCICAGNMEEDRAAASGREKVLRLTAARREKWPYRRGWRTSAKGNPYMRHGRLVLMVYPMFRGKPEGGYGFTVVDRRRDRELIRSSKFIADEREAMLRTFDAVEWLDKRGIKANG
jgi:hypothetical protein